MDTLERVISSDDHVDLSHDRVKSFLASHLHDDYDSAVDRCRVVSGITAEANARWREQQGLEADTGKFDLSDLSSRRYPSAGRAGYTDPHERLRDMDTDGVDASSTYCEVSAFRYLYLLERGSKEATRAFNTALGEFASVDPHRLIVSYQIPIHDIAAAVDEVHWVASQGGKSLQLPVFPPELGLPDYWDVRYDPLWSAITETQLPICSHIGLNTQLEQLGQRDPTPQKGILCPPVCLSTSEALGMWIMGGVFERFPELKVVFVEPGVGWVAWWLYLVDDFVLRQGYDFPAITELPSHYFRKNVHLTFIDEPTVLRDARERLGIENIMWSSDYPHPVSSWPKSQATIDAMFSDATAEERYLITCGNAERVWKL